MPHPTIYMSDLAARQGLTLEQFTARHQARRSPILQQRAQSVAAKIKPKGLTSSLYSNPQYSNPYFIARNNLVNDALTNPQNYNQYLEDGRINFSKLLYDNNYITFEKVASNNPLINPTAAAAYTSQNSYEQWVDANQNAPLDSTEVPCIDMRYAVIGFDVTNEDLITPGLDNAALDYFTFTNSMIRQTTVNNSKFSRFNMDGIIMIGLISQQSSWKNMIYETIYVLPGHEVTSPYHLPYPTQFIGCTLANNQGVTVTTDPNSMPYWQTGLFQDCTFEQFSFPYNAIDYLVISSCTFLTDRNTTFDNSIIKEIFFDKTSTGTTLLSLQQINAGVDDGVTYASLITLSPPSPIVVDGQTTQPKNRTLYFALFSGSTTMFYPEQLVNSVVAQANFTDIDADHITTVYCYYDDRPLTGEAIATFFLRATQNDVSVTADTPPTAAPTSGTTVLAATEDTTTSSSTVTAVKDASIDPISCAIGTSLLGGALCAPSILPYVAVVSGAYLLGKQISTVAERLHGEDTDASSVSNRSTLFQVPAQASSPYDTKTGRDSVAVSHIDLRLPTPSA